VTICAAMLLERLGHDASGVFIVDETGFAKKGVRSQGAAPVHRQPPERPTTAAGSVLAYASSRGGVDRSGALSADILDRGSGRVRRARIRLAQVRDKPQQGVAMLAGARRGGPVGWRDRG